MSFAIVSIVGNPRAESRTHGLARTLCAALRAVAPDSTSEEIDLAMLGQRVLAPDDAAVESALARTLAADVLVVASPTYKGTYSGLLKGFLDRLGHQALRGTGAVPILLGGAPDHSLAINVHFAPLLLELGATVPAGGLFVLESDVEDFAAAAERWVAVNGPALLRVPGSPISSGVA